MTIAGTSRIIERLAGALCLLALGGAAVFCAWDLHQTQVQARGTIAGLQRTIDAISGPRGTLWQVNKAVVKVGDAVVTTQMQERKVTPATVETVKQLGTAAGKLGDAADALKGTANAGTETLGEGKRTIAAAQPLLASLTRTSDASTLSIQHLDALLTSKDLADAMHHTAAMTASGDAIMADAKTVADAAKVRFLKPTPWYRKIIPYATAGAKIASYALPW